MATSKKQQKLKAEIEALAINIVDKERINWEEAVCYVTEKVGFRMRYLIRTLRKNYWGVFDEPTDQTTSREKIWIPLIRSIVEDVVKNIDKDQKDLQFRAKSPEYVALTDITRAYVQEYLSNMFFGEILDETERQAAIDGTVVWKTWEEDGVLKRRTVDLLHIYIDPTEQSIQSAFRFTERALMTPDELAGMTGWMNTKGVVGSQTLSKNDIRAGAQSVMGVPTTGKFVDVWECWGKIPKKLVTGDFKADDAEDYVDGHIIVSGLEAGDKRVHLIELNKNTDNMGNIIKPYEELRLAKISGRWYGLGIAERAMALQEWLNTVVNLRVNKSYVSQLGLFQIRKGSNITPQMLAKLPSNGAVTVTAINQDIAPLATPPVDQTSYQDEEAIVNWAQKVTQAYPVSTGEELPASQSATAVAVQNTGSKSGYAMMADQIGFFLERWMDRHALKTIVKGLKVGDIVRLTGDDESFKAIAEKIVSNIAKRNLDLYYTHSIVPTEDEVQIEIQNAIEKLTKSGTLFIKLVQEVIASGLYSKFYVTNEDMDTTVAVQNLIQMLNLAPEYKESTVKTIFDLMGLPQPKKAIAPQMQPGQEMPQEQAPTPSPMNPQQVTTNAVTPQLNG